MAYTTNYSFKRFDATGSIMYVVVNILNDASTPVVVETINSFPIRLPIDATGAVLEGANLDSHITTTLANVFDANYLQQRKYQYDNGNVVTNASIIYTLTSEIEAGEQDPQVLGLIFDSSGTPVNGVTVTSSNGESATTDISGGFIFAATAGTQKVTASKTGYYDNFKMITVDGITNVNITLLAESGTGSSVSLTGLNSGTVTGTGTGRASNNAEVEFPVNAIVDDFGFPAASATMKIGNIAVSDTGSTDVFPGYFLGDINGSNDPIESYGYINVSVEDGSGNSLSLDPAVGATIRMPVDPDPVGENTIPTWRLNETTGIWEQGTDATRVGATNVFEFQVTSFSWWNIDKPLPDTCTLTVTVNQVSDGTDGELPTLTVLRGVEVTVNVTEEQWGAKPTIWQGRGISDLLGRVTMEVPPGALAIEGKKGALTFYPTTAYETDEDANGACIVSMSLLAAATTPTEPPLTLIVPEYPGLNQPATLIWDGGKSWNSIIVEILDPITGIYVSTFAVENSMRTAGSVDFTPTVEMTHQFYIEATDANGDVTTEYADMVWFDINAPS